MEKGQIVNTYFNCPDKLSYLGIPFLSDQHTIFLNGVGKLGRADHYESNHLFAQFYCIYLDNSNLSIIRKNLCWDKTLNTISLDPSFPLINFMSRDLGKIHDLEGINLHTVNASEDSSIGFPHSEFILLKYLEEGITPIANAIPKENNKILYFGLVIYSSLDSCDTCQKHLFQSFSPSSRFLQKLEMEAPESINIPWFITYFSSHPCKKSSYISISEGSLNHFYYDKANKKFYSLLQPELEMTFPCSIEAFDLGKITEPLFFMSFIE